MNLIRFEFGIMFSVWFCFVFDMVFLWCGLWFGYCFGCYCMVNGAPFSPRLQERKQKQPRQRLLVDFSCSFEMVLIWFEDAVLILDMWIRCSFICDSDVLCNIILQTKQQKPNKTIQNLKRNRNHRFDTHQNHNLDPCENHKCSIEIRIITAKPDQKQVIVAKTRI